jgi:hypothetical protein
MAAFPCYVVLVRGAFEVKVEQWMGHGIPPIQGASSSTQTLRDGNLA